MSLLFFINPTFDVSFNGSSSYELTNISLELQYLFVAACNSNDYVKVDNLPNESFFENLMNFGIKPSNIWNNEKVDQGVVWGWNYHAESFFTGNKIVYNYPAISVVKDVNSLRFSMAVSKKFNCGVPDSYLCNSEDDIIKCSEEQKITDIWIKPNHGSSGYGIVRTNKENIAADIKKISDYPVVVQPHLNRVSDISTGFNISKNGTVSEIIHHQTLCNRYGTYFASFIIPGNSLIYKYGTKLDNMAKLVSSELFKVGYYGPAGFDSFVYSSGGEFKLAYCIEINARLSMGRIAFMLKNKLNINKCFALRYISKKRIDYFTSYTELYKRLGSLLWSKGDSCGVIPISPLYKIQDGKEKRLAHYAFAIVANSGSQLESIDEKLRVILRAR